MQTQRIHTHTHPAQHTHTQCSTHEGTGQTDQNADLLLLTETKVIQESSSNLVSWERESFGKEQLLHAADSQSVHWGRCRKGRWSGVRMGSQEEGGLSPKQTQSRDVRSNGLVKCMLPVGVVREIGTGCVQGKKRGRGLQVKFHAQPDPRGALKCGWHLGTPSLVSHCL